MIKIICIGKKHELMYQDAIEHFQKRLGHWQKVEWIILPPSGNEGDSARNDESERMLARISPDSFVVLLDETGVCVTSKELAKYVEQAQNSSRSLTLIIGGAYGVNQILKNQACEVIAFGKSVFPHQLMRVMLLEQLYRAYSINAGSNYHHV